MNAVKRALLVLIVFSVACSCCVVAALASEPPLEIISAYDRSSGTLTLKINTKTEITAANYDLVLQGWENVFVIERIACNVAGFSALGNTETGGVSSMSSTYYDVSIPAGTCLAAYTMNVPSGTLEPGTYSFTLTVTDAANESGGALSWKGAVVTDTFTLTAPAAAELTGVRTDGATVTVAAIFRVEGAVLCCAAYQNSGQMAAAKTAQAVSDGSEHSYSLELGTTEYSFVKVFVLGAGWKPLCESVREPSQ